MKSTQIIMGGVILAAATFSAFAGSQAQIDTQTNTLAAYSTNTYALYGDITGTLTNGAALASPNAFIDCTKTASGCFVVGGYFANTTASPTNVMFGIYSSQDVKLWAPYTNVLVNVPGNSTNYYSTQFNVSEGVGGISAEYALRFVAITNSAGVTAPTNTPASSTPGVYLFLKAFTRTGF